MSDTLNGYDGTMDAFERRIGAKWRILIVRSRPLTTPRELRSGAWPSLLRQRQGSWSGPSQSLVRAGRPNQKAKRVTTDSPHLLRNKDASPQGSPNLGPFDTIIRT